MARGLDEDTLFEAPLARPLSYVRLFNCFKISGSTQPSNQTRSLTVVLEQSRTTFSKRSTSVQSVWCWPPHPAKNGGYHHSHGPPDVLPTPMARISSSWTCCNRVFVGLSTGRGPFHSGGPPGHAKQRWCVHLERKRPLWPGKDSPR